MKKYLFVFLASLLFAGVAIISLSRFLTSRNEQIVQDLTRRCVERGSIASSSIASGLLSYQVKFSCTAKADNGPRTTPIEGASEAK